MLNDCDSAAVCAGYESSVAKLGKCKYYLIFKAICFCETFCNFPVFQEGDSFFSGGGYCAVGKFQENSELLFCVGFECFNLSCLIHTVKTFCVSTNPHTVFTILHKAADSQPLHFFCKFIFFRLTTFYINHRKSFICSKINLIVKFYNRVYNGF